MLKRFTTNKWPEFFFFVCLWVIVIWQEVQLWNQNAFAIVFIQIVLGEIPSLYTYMTVHVPVHGLKIMNVY